MNILKVAGLCVLLGASTLFAGEPTPPKRILFFTKSQRVEHAVIKQPGGKPSLAETVLAELGAKNSFEITTTKDAGVFTAESMAKYDALLFYSNGTLTDPKSVDGTPPMTAEAKALLIDTVRNGKPLIAVHSALMTFNGFPGKVDPYLEMLGGEGIGHNKEQQARNTCVDAKFPGCEDLKDGVDLFEEWYSMKNCAPDLHVILVQETKGMTGTLYQRPPYPATWARMYGKGRVFVTAMGHRDDVWKNPIFQKMLVGGISWAVGRMDADITPNIQTVTPHCADLPPGK